MARATPPPPVEIPFAADWEWCDAKVTYLPKWQSLGSTPGQVSVSPSRSYRVSVRSDTTTADLAAIVRAVPACNIHAIRIPHAGPISATDLGQVLAGLRGVETVELSWPDESTAWFELSQTGGVRLRFELEGWPADEVAAALSRTPRAARLTLQMGAFKDRFRLGPLFGIRGLERIEVRHVSYAKQSLDWTGLSGLNGLKTLIVDRGFFDPVFWAEFGRLKKVRELQLKWPEGAKASPGSLSRLTSLKRLLGSCTFDRTPEVFRALAECPALEEVKIDQCRIDDASAAGLGSMPAVKTCYLWNVEFTNKGMQALCRWPAIKSFTLAENSSNSPPITDTGFAAIRNLQTLETLHLQGFEKVTARGWAAVGQLPRLKNLKLLCIPPFDLIEAIGPLPTVERLVSEHFNSLGPGGVRVLQAMPRLKTLVYSVHRYSPYTAPLDELSELRQLRSLFLGGVHTMTDAQLGRFANLTGLEELSLDETAKVTDAGIAALAGLKKLRLLSLAGLPKLTDRTIPTVAAFPRLETLLVRCTGKITDRGLAGLSAARRLKVLHLEHARNLTGEVLLQLAGELPLEELAVDSSPHLTDEHLMRLAEHPTLKRVSILQCKNVSAEGRAALEAARPDWQRAEYHRWLPLWMRE